MNVDAPFPHFPFSALPGRPVANRSEQASARPVERPHHDEPANNQTRQDTRPTDSPKDGRQPAGENRLVRQESELSADEKRELEQLKARDREVHAHEAAHRNAAGSLVRGGAQFDYQTGPDGRRYAVGGEVSIDTSPVPGDPQATLRKADTVRHAANAPLEPSTQDRRVAAKAAQMAARARHELLEQQRAERAADTSANHPDLKIDHTEPARVGELIDVTA
jgi:hypothetical protein